MNFIYNAADLLGRIFLIILFVVAGFGKVGGYASTAAYMESHSVSSSLLPLVILTEIGGSLLILIGWHTRIVAFLMAGFTLLTLLLFHMPIADHGEQIVVLAELATAGGFLVLTGRGAGGWSLDARRQNAKGHINTGEL